MYKLTVEFVTKDGELNAEVREEKSLPRIQRQATEIIAALPAFGHKFKSYEIVNEQVEAPPKGWDKV